MSTLTVGDRVGYAKLFLKTIGTFGADDAWFRQGIITAVDGGYVTVRWDDDRSRAVTAHNTSLAKVGSAKWAEDI